MIKMIKVIVENREELLKVCERIIGDEFADLRELEIFAQLREEKIIIDEKLSKGLTFDEAYGELMSENILKPIEDGSLTEQELVDGFNAGIATVEETYNDVARLISNIYPEHKERIMDLYMLCAEQVKTVKVLYVPDEIV